MEASRFVKGFLERVISAWSDSYEEEDIFAGGVDGSKDDEMLPTARRLLLGRCHHWRSAFRNRPPTISSKDMGRRDESFFHPDRNRSLHKPHVR